MRNAKISGRLFACSAHASACALRQSPNANGSAESRSALGSLYSRQHHSQTPCVCSVMFSWTFGVAPLAAAPRLLEGRSVGKALPHFHSEPYVTLHPRRGFAYIRHVVAHPWCATPFPHLRDLFRPDARNFPRRRKAGFGDVRRIFAFDFAQICAVQISGVIIEKSRRSCCFRCSP